MIIIGLLASLVAVHAAVTGGRRLARGLRDASSLAVVRAIRRLVTAVAAAVVALAVLVGEHGLLAFAAVFLAEELYETGVLLLILRASPAEPG